MAAPSIGTSLISQKEYKENKRSAVSARLREARGGHARNAVRLVGELLSREDIRLLTLTGPGGTGKTRLALQLAADQRGVFPDGMVFVDLASIRDPALVIPTIAGALDVQEVAGQTQLDLLKSTLREKHVLNDRVGLDNFIEFESDSCKNSCNRLLFSYRD